MSTYARKSFLRKERIEPATLTKISPKSAPLKRHKNAHEVALFTREKDEHTYRYVRFFFCFFSRIVVLAKATKVFFVVVKVSEEITPREVVVVVNRPNDERIGKQQQQEQENEGQQRETRRTASGNE